MAITQRPGIGVSNVVYAVLTESSDVLAGTPAWGTVYSLPGCVSVEYNPNGSAATLFADDGAFVSSETTGNLDLSLNMVDILPEHEARILGHTYSNGQILKKGSDISPYVAVGFKQLLSGKDGANAVYGYVWFYKGKFMKPAVSNQTKGDTTNYQTTTLAGQFVKLIANDAYMNKLRTDDTNASATVIANFFNQPYIPTVDATALTATIAESGTPGSIAITFAKGSGSSFTMDSTSITSSTIVITTDAGGVVPGSFVVGGAGTTVVVTFTPTTPFGGSGVAGVVVTSDVKDSSGTRATVTGDVISAL